jgi:hypothetical protein
MEEIVSQIEKEFEDLETLMQHKAVDNSPTNAPTKIKRSSIRTRLRKGEDIVTSLESQLSTLSSTQRKVIESRLRSKWDK